MLSIQSKNAEYNLFYFLLQSHRDDIHVVIIKPTLHFQVLNPNLSIRTGHFIAGGTDGQTRFLIKDQTSLGAGHCPTHMSAKLWKLRGNLFFFFSIFKIARGQEKMG